MEEVRRIGDVLFVNDSKATNADAAERALSSFEEVFWIAGGKPKAGGIEPLAPYFPRVRKAYLIGVAAEEFARTLDGKVPYEIVGTLDAAVPAAARDAAASGLKHPVVLLSPACASFDQFPNFEVQGRPFPHPGDEYPGNITSTHIGRIVIPDAPQARAGIARRCCTGLHAIPALRLRGAALGFAARPWAGMTAISSGR